MLPSGTGDSDRLSAADASADASFASSAAIAAVAKPSTFTAPSSLASTASTVGVDELSVEAERAAVRAEMRKSMTCIDSCEKPPGGIDRVVVTLVLLASSDCHRHVNYSEWTIVEKAPHRVRTASGHGVQTPHLTTSPSRQLLYVCN